MAPRDATESEPAVELTVRSLKEAEELVAAAGAYRWARARFVKVDVPGIDSLGDAAMVLARLLPLMLREGWMVYSTRLLTEADLLFESLNELWWEVADVVEGVHAAVDHLRGSGEMDAEASSAEEEEEEEHDLQAVDGDVGEGAEAEAAAAEKMDGEVGVAAAEAAARRCSSRPDGDGEGAGVGAEEIVDGETASPDHVALASAALRRARDGMREVTAAATAEALQFALDGMGDDDAARANKAALTPALLSMRTRLGKHCGLALFTSNMKNCRDMAVLGHELTKATGVLLPLRRRRSSKGSESDDAEPPDASSGPEATAQTPASSEPRDHETTAEARIAHLERLVAAASPLLDVIDHMRKAAVSFDQPASARAPPPPSSTEDDEEEED